MSTSSSHRGIYGALLGLGLAGLIGLGGCELHVAERDDGPSRGPIGERFCDETGCYECDEVGCYRIGDPGEPCARHFDCPAGCYCDDHGVCQQSGFCRDDADCPRGFACDLRDSCVPERGGAGER